MVIPVMADSIFYTWRTIWKKIWRCNAGEG